MPQPSVQERAELKRKFHDALTWAVALVILVTPLAISVRGVGGAGLIKTVVAQSMILVLVAAWLVKTAVSETRPRFLPALELPIVVFVCLSALSLERTSDIGSGFLKFSQLVLFASAAIICTDVFERREDVLRVLSVTVLAGFLVSAYGIAQHYGKDFIQWETGQLDIREAPATLGNPNFAAQFLVAALPLSVAVLLALPGLWRRTSVSICTCMMFAHLWFTRARSGFVGIAAAFVVMSLALLWNRLSRGSARMKARARTMLLIVLVAVFAGIAGVASRGYPRRILRFSDENIASRILTWHGALNMVRDNPWRGVGLGDFYATSPAYWSAYHQRMFVEEVKVVRRAHNDFLETAAETGIPGLAAFLLVLTVAGVLLGRRVGKEEDFGSRAVLAGVGASLAGVSAQTLFTFGLQNASSALFFWTLIGLTGGIIRSGARDRGQSASSVDQAFAPVTKILLYALAALLICMVPLRFRAVGADYRVRAAQTFLESDEFEEASAELDRAILLDPLNFDALYKRSVAAAALGEYQEAERLYRKCLRFRPNDVLTLTDLGMVLLGKARVEEAMPFFNNALSLAPSYQRARAALASCYLALGKRRQAAAELRTAYEYDPQDPRISLDLARSYRDLGAREDAIGQYEKTLSVDTDNSAASIELGSLYLARGNHARATELLERGLLLNPAAVGARIVLAQAYLAGGKFLEAALECGNYVVRGGAERERARLLAQHIDAELGGAEEPAAKERAELARFVLARVYLALGEPERALEQLRRIAGQNRSVLFQQRVKQRIAQLEKQSAETNPKRSDGK